MSKVLICTEKMCKLYKEGKPCEYKAENTGILGFDGLAECVKDSTVIVTVKGKCDECSD